MKKLILFTCSLCLSLSAFAKLEKMSDDEMRGVTGEIFSPSFSAREATIILQLLAHNDRTVGKLSQKINQKLAAVQLEKVAQEHIYQILRRANGIAYSDALLGQQLVMTDRMILNRKLYNQQMLADEQRRAIISAFIGAIVNSNFQKEPTLDKVVSALNLLNPSKLLSQYPNLNSPIYSYGKPNSPNINIVGKN